MQLTPAPGGRRRALCAAVAGLLGQSAYGDDGHQWQFDSALLLYTEKGDRVNVVEPVVHGRRELDDGGSLELDVIVDVLTGATPTGAVPADEPQTFARPSGVGHYTTPAGELPVDDTFQDTRMEVGMSHTQPLSANHRVIYGGKASVEYDFVSTGVNATLAQDFNRRNTTLSAGLAYEYNEADPEGGVPTPLSAADIGEREPHNTRPNVAERRQVDLLLGVTQVLNRHSIAQLNLSYSESDGYHADPFKLVTLVDADSGAPLSNRYEHRPDTRQKQSVFVKLNAQLPRDVISTSYRFLSDDWGVDSHTWGIRYRFVNVAGHGDWEPHIRFHKQSAADFYRTSLPNDNDIPEFASADYRLARMTTWTAGVKYIAAADEPFEVRVEYMVQKPDASPGSRVGYLATRRVVPETEALRVQFNYLF